MNDLNEYHIRLIKKGLRAAEEGKFVSHAEMKKLIAKMTRRLKGGKERQNAEKAKPGERDLTRSAQRSEHRGRRECEEESRE